MREASIHLRWITREKAANSKVSELTWHSNRSLHSQHSSDWLLRDVRSYKNRVWTAESSIHCRFWLRSNLLFNRGTQQHRCEDSELALQLAYTILDTSKCQPSILIPIAGSSSYRAPKLNSSTLGNCCLRLPVSATKFHARWTKDVETFASYLLRIAFCASLSACAPNENTLLMFGQAQTLGISISGSTTQQSVELTLGYRDIDIALVPTTAGSNSRDIRKLQADAAGPKGAVSHDALSVLGQFDANAKSGSSEVGLGKFFATGLAAKRLADGFAHKMGAPETPNEPTE